MNREHIKAILEGVVPELKSAIDVATKPLLDRIDALEKRPALKGEKGDPGRDGVPGEPGKDGVPGAKGMDGKDGAAGEPGPSGKDGSPGERGEKGLDGKDGAPGRDGQPGVPGSPGRDGADGKDGAVGINGKDGRDGFGLDDFAISTEDGGRTFVMTFQRAEQIIRRECKTDIVLDRGVWRQGDYAKGDGVTLNGSFWIAQKDTATKPETPDCDWRLAVKRGRDGKDGKPGDKGVPGPEGKPGRDGRQW